MSNGNVSSGRATHLTGVDLAAAQALLAQQEMTTLAQSMQRNGRSPDAIINALYDANSLLPSPLSEDDLDAIIDVFTEGYRNGYAPRLTRVSMNGFMEADYPPPRFIVDQLIPRSEVTLAGGHGGSGKSILFLSIAAHVACGKGWDRFDVEQCPVVFISLEDPADHVMYRLKKIVGECLLDADAVSHNLQVFDGTAAPELMVEVNDHGTRNLIAEPTMHEIERAVAGAGLLIIDNVSDAYGGNENERRSVRTFIRHFAGMARANDAAVVLLAHIDKAAARDGANGNSYSGSTAWHNSTRSRLALVDVDGQWQLQHEKFNRSRQAEPINLMWTLDGVLVPGATQGAAGSREQQAKSDADAALLVIRAAHARLIQVPAGTRGTATAWSAVEDLLEMETFWGRNGKRRFRTALLYLQEANLLARREEWNEQNNLRAHLELTAMGEAAARRMAP